MVRLLNGVRVDSTGRPKLLPPISNQNEMHSAAAKTLVSIQRRQVATKVPKKGPIAAKCPKVFPVCLQCGEKFKSTKNLKIHLAQTKKLPNGCKKQTYKCQHNGCSFSTWRNDFFVRHLRIHTGEKNFKCLKPWCKQSFPRKDNRDRHSKTCKQKNAAKNPMTCPVKKCLEKKGKLYRTANKYNLLAHVLSCSEKYYYKCHQCELRFHTEQTLLTHCHRIHGGVNPPNQIEIDKLLPPDILEMLPYDFD